MSSSRPPQLAEPVAHLTFDLVLFSTPMLEAATATVVDGNFTPFGVVTVANFAGDNVETAKMLRKGQFPMSSILFSPILIRVPLRRRRVEHASLGLSTIVDPRRLFVARRWRLSDGD